jgi:3',5'-cyclic AMP phosphodiesterase CpdA
MHVHRVFVRWVFAAFLLVFALGAVLGSVPCGAQGTQGPASFQFALYGDCRNGHDAHRQLVAQMMALKPAFVVCSGDFVEKGDDAAEWKTFDEITGKMRKAVPFYPVIGNHDVEKKGAGLYEKYLKVPTNTGQMQYYSFDYGNCHFIILDTVGSLAPDGAQYRWLQADLKASEGKATHRFVVMHHPLYTLVPLRTSPAAKLRAQLLPLLKESKVCAVFTGHDHHFFYTRRDGVAQVLSGGGGAPLYPLAPSLARPGDLYGRYNHFLWVKVSPERVQVSVRDVDGQTKAEFLVCSHDKAGTGSGEGSAAGKAGAKN